jgi:hypothetical protein
MISKKERKADSRGDSPDFRTEGFDKVAEHDE